VRAKLRFLRYLLFKKAEAQSIEQEEAEKTEINYDQGNPRRTFAFNSGSK